MAVGQLGLNQHVHQPVELVIGFDRGKNKRKKLRNRYLCS